MGKQHYIIPIFVPHIGCPHNCVFCNQNIITGSSNYVDSKYVESTIEEYLKTLPSNAEIEVSFFGGTFTAIPMAKQNELLSVAKAYKDKGLIKYIHMSTRPDYIDENILSNLKNYSTDIIELGVQSMDDEVLKASGRGHSVNDVIRASKLIKSFGFVLGLQIMPGLPLDTFAKDIETANELVKLKPELMRIYPSLVIKDTPMEKMFLEGKYRPYSLEEAIEICKKLYKIFYLNNINVIRMGLQPTHEINTGAKLVAGPFHPSFKELVLSSIYNEMLEEKLRKIDTTKITIYINPKEISMLYADKKRFFLPMKNKFENVAVNVIQDKNIEIGTIKINNENLISLYDYIKYNCN